MEEIQRLIDRCNKCKLDECINCEISYSEVQAIKELVKRNKRLEKQILDLTAENLKLSVKALNEHIKDKQISNEQLEALNLGWKMESEKKDKIIDKIKNRIFLTEDEHKEIIKIQRKYENKSYEDCVIKYFERQVEENGN